MKHFHAVHPTQKRKRFTGCLFAFELYQAVDGTRSRKSTCLFLYLSLRQSDRCSSFLMLLQSLPLVHICTCACFVVLVMACCRIGVESGPLGSSLS